MSLYKIYANNKNGNWRVEVAENGAYAPLRDYDFRIDAINAVLALDKRNCVFAEESGVTELGRLDELFLSGMPGSWAISCAIDSYNSLCLRLARGDMGQAGIRAFKRARINKDMRRLAGIYNLDVNASLLEENNCG
tara:strand:- start:516 stop:923 length:408 start_codon:yes stop_codon:yes gene_type:complete